ncbi:MAG: hypothetical protein WCK77_21245 [Verrucomicrobiota bacterium]
MLPVYDFCLFNNEFEMLDLRLRYMQNFVCKFFVCELDITYQGNPKEYHSETFLSKYRIGGELLGAGRLHFVKISNSPEKAYFAIEHEHRIAFSKWVVENVDHDFWGLLCDCDEIVSESVQERMDHIGDSANLDLKTFYFAADNHSYRQSWLYARIFRSRVLKSCNFQELRMSANDTIIPDMGWHFSSFGGYLQVADKLKSFSHMEFNNSEYSDKWTLFQRMKTRQDYLGRAEFPCKEFDIGNYPDKLLEIIVEKAHFSSVYNLFGTFEEMLVHSSEMDCNGFVRSSLPPDSDISRRIELSPGVFIDLYILYHVACIGDWKEVVSEQLSVVKSSGLMNISVSLLGTPSDRNYLLALASDLNLELLIEYLSEELDNYEFPAMVLLDRWCRKNPSGCVLYFHTKGVSRPRDTIRKSWRRLMGKYVIEGWMDNCLALEQGYDVVGVNWRNMGKRSHFTGNFFIARAIYILSLGEFSDHFERFLVARGYYHPRMAAEFWLGSGNSSPRFLSHVSCDEDMTSMLYWEKYRSLLPPGGDWMIGRDAKRVTIKYAYTGHGTIGFDGGLGYEGLNVSHPNNPELTISAHADSVLTIDIAATLRIYGFLNGTASACEGAIFYVDGIHLGTVYQRHDVSDGLVILPGVHELRVASLRGIGYCHTVWSLEFL